MTVVDLFAGCGGWDLGARDLGIDPIGLEFDRWACSTRAAIGLQTIRCDISTYPPPRKITGLIASPPCQDFSVAGKGAGRSGERGRLVDVVPEWVRACQPDWIACEQVPPVLPIWQEHAIGYREAGYSTWCGILNAADYGVPQTRKRAILLASRDRVVRPPTPTHARHPQSPLFGPGRARWVTMAEALGWGRAVGPLHAITTRAHTGNGAGGSNQRKAIDAEVERGLWVLDRPATTIVGSFCPDVVAAPGYRQAGDGPRQDAPGSVRITERDAMILQGFPPDLPLQGPKTARFLQIGNAFPPPVARRVLEVVS